MRIIENVLFIFQEISSMSNKPLKSEIYDFVFRPMRMRSGLVMAMQ